MSDDVVALAAGIVIGLLLYALASVAGRRSPACGMVAALLLAGVAFVAAVITAAYLDLASLGQRLT